MPRAPLWRQMYDRVERSPKIVHNALRVLKPAGDLNSYVMLWQNLSGNEQMAAYQAMGRWTRDHVPLPGAAFRQLVQMTRDNAIVNDTMLLGGKPVHLTDASTPQYGPRSCAMGHSAPDVHFLGGGV